MSKIRLGAVVLREAPYGKAGTEEGATGATAAVSRLTTMTYSAMLLAPALVGRVAQPLGLTWTPALLVPLLVTVAWKAPVVARIPSSSTPPGAVWRCGVFSRGRRPARCAAAAVRW
ncbi:hypothetical protein [Microbispora sp. CA-102843]|uniref:hypothetical protein n=1 Tax=Microbispora sp. CA-102843 TaxID=3239952 RepID=UPI003D90ABA1